MKNIIMSPDGLYLRKASLDDLEFIMRTEHHEDNKDFIIRWTLEQHKVSLEDADKQSFIIETRTRKSVGYVIIAGLNNMNHSVELVRIVISEKGKGYGTQAIQMLQKYVFESLKAHRLWLDVKDYNQRARHIYESLGFKIEGTLRECLKNENRYDSLVIMSMLKNEFHEISKTIEEH